MKWKATDNLFHQFRRCITIVTSLMVAVLSSSCSIPLSSEHNRKFFILGFGYVVLEESKDSGVVQASSRVIGVNVINSEIQTASIGISKSRLAIAPLDENGLILENTPHKLEIYKPTKGNKND